MTRFAIRLLTLTIFSSALLAAPTFVSTCLADGDQPNPMATPTPPPPSASPTNTRATTTTKPSKSKKKKTSDASPPGIEDPAFANGYRTAYSTIYDHNDYTAAIAQLKALGHDDNAAVANLLGYSYRKLGDYKVSQVWYERALKIDPDHVKTWQYYGLWQVEQGNRDQAEYHLSRLAALVGTDSEEYRSLAAALEQPPGTGLVY
jgi:predicted Zn-dependent protease